MVRNSQLGNEVAAEMYQRLGSSFNTDEKSEVIADESAIDQLRAAVFEIHNLKKEASVQEPPISKAAAYKDLLYSLSKVSSDLDDLGMDKTSAGVLHVMEHMISEAGDILEELGLESKEHDNVDKALERRPDIKEDLAEELKQDPDIQVNKEDPRLEGLSFLDDIGMDLEQQLALYEDDVDEESEVVEKLQEREPQMRKEQLERLMKEWSAGNDLDSAIATVDGWLEKFASYDAEGFDDAPPADVDLELDLSLQDLLPDDETLDSHMIDTYLASDGEWEDE
jgi:hypothetical protein